MQSNHDGISTCPYCRRTVRTCGNRYMMHNDGNYERVCPMSGQREPVEGDTPTSYVSRAHLVADLASQIQDSDPTIVWAYLGALSPDELRRMTMLALAGLNINQTIKEMYGWVCDLPAAKAVSA